MVESSCPTSCRSAAAEGGRLQRLGQAAWKWAGQVINGKATAPAGDAGFDRIVEGNSLDGWVGDLMFWGVL